MIAHGNNRQFTVTSGEGWPRVLNPLAGAKGRYRNSHQLFWTIISLWLFLVTTIASATLPEPAESRLLKVTGAGFTADTGPSDIVFKYAVTLTIKQPDHPAWHLIIAYENPQHPDVPIIQNLEVAPNQLEVLCPPEEVSGLKNGRDYFVAVRLYEDGQRKKEIDRLTQAIRFYIDPTLFKEIQKGLRTNQTTTQRVNAGYNVYDNQELGVHIKYPESWHFKLSETEDVRQILFSRESVNEPPGKYKVGMQIMQFHDIGRKAPWLDLSDPDKAADQWLNATLQATPGQNELVEAKIMTVGGKRAYYVEFLMRPDNGYPAKYIKLTIFYPHTFTELVCEAPEEEFESVKALFQEAINDVDLAF